MENLPIEIKLTLGQWNLVLNALGQRPFAEVNEVIMAIKAQGEAAVAAAAPASEPALAEASEEVVQ
jgi:hypothetical protein